jgi:hypothetical protein
MLLLAGMFGAAGGFVGARQTGMLCPLDSGTCSRFAVFWNAWDILSRNYVDPKAIDPGARVAGRSL